VKQVAFFIGSSSMTHFKKENTHIRNQRRKPCVSSYMSRINRKTATQPNLFDMFSYLYSVLQTSSEAGRELVLHSCIFNIFH
jgi:maleate cis-trans isomerase